MGRRKPLCSLGGLRLVQAVLIVCSLDSRGLLTRPIRNVDYTSHFYSANHFATHLPNTHAFWGYDPFWMAGYPEGFVGLVDNKLFAALTSLAPRGLEAVTFNAAVLLAILSVPWLIFWAARIAGGSREEAAGSALAATALTFAAPITVLVWVAGAISFLLASALALPAGLGIAVAVSEGSLFSLRGLGFLALALLAVFTHPTALLPLAAALAPLPFVARRALGRIVLEVAVVAALLAVPLLPVAEGALANRAQARAIDPRGEFLRGGPSQLVRDFGTHLLRTDEHGVNGAGALAAVLLAAGWGIFRRRSRPGGRAADAATLLGLVLFSGLPYAASWAHPRLAALQPHRFLALLGLFAALPAGRGLVEWMRGLRAGRVPAVLLTGLSLVIVAEAGWALRGVRVLGAGHDAAEELIPAFLAEEPSDAGRVLVESTLHAVPAAASSSRNILLIRFALLPLVIDRELLGNTRTGPFTAERYAGFGDGSILGRRLADISAAELRELLDAYAVSTVIACAPETIAVLDRFAAILDPRAELAECRGFRVRDAQTSRLLEGGGEVRATFDRIEVQAARGERLVLKYHWIPTLRSEPLLPIEEAPWPGSPVGFIAVRPGSTRDFVIRTR